MHKKKLQYRENYIKALRHLNGDADHIIDHVRKMDLDELLDLFYTEKVADIRFPYEKQERERIVYELERVYQVRKGK